MNDPEIPDAEDLRKLVEEIAQTHIPFGMYGPAKYPPKGCPLMDVPQEYLAWLPGQRVPERETGPSDGTVPAAERERAGLSF